MRTPPERRRSGAGNRLVIGLPLMTAAPPNSARFVLRPRRWAALGVAMLVACSNDPAPATPTRSAPPALPVQAVEITPRDLSRTVQVSSAVEPLRTIRLASRSEGVLTDVDVDTGDRVRTGQVLARIDVSEHLAELARARARLQERELAFQRMEQLRESGHIDAASHDSARAERDIAASEVELWQTRVAFGTVRSTIDGVVIARHIEPGEAVARHDVLFELADLQTMVVRIGVSELDVRALRVGDEVSVQLDALDRGEPIAGSVRRIFPAAEPGSRLVTVEIDLPDGADKGVRPGFLARAQLLVDQRADVLAVPAGAMAEAEGGHYVMLINDDMRLERRSVSPGVSRGGWQELLEGVKPGERVVATNPLDLNEGTTVRIVGWAG